LFALSPDLLNLVALGRCLDELQNEHFRIAPSNLLPERALAQAVLLGVVVLAKAYRVPIIGLLTDASAAPGANMRDLDWAPIAAGNAAPVRAHKVTVRL
jgi:hypothetical protein